MVQDMMDVSEVLKSFGGAQAVATLLEITPQAITNMKARGTIPARHWPKLVEEARARQIDTVTYESLAAIRPSEAA